MSNGSIKENTQKSLEFIKQYSDKYITLTAIEPDKGIETRTFELSKLSQCKRWIDKYQGTHNIYFSVNPTKYPVNKKANKKDIASMDWLHVDIDPIPDKDLKKERKRILADLKKFKPAPTIIIDSGGGYQGFWKLNPNIKINSIPQATELEGYNKQLEILFDSDHTHNIDRIMRLPGTINVPTKKKKEKGRKPALSKLVEFNDTTYNISEFDKATSRTNTQDLSDIDTGNLPDVDLESLDVTDYIKMIIIHGQDEDEPDKYPSRSEAVFAVTCALKRAEVEDSMIAAILLDKRFKISEHVLEQPHPMKYAERQVLRATEYQSNKFHLTDVGNGRRLSILHGENLRYIHEIKKWMFWDGNLWIIDKNEEIIRLAKDTALNIYHEAMKEQDQERRIKISKWANASEKMDRINAMVKAARSEPDIPISPARLDANPWLIQVSNGVVNLKTGQLIRPERDFYITKQSSVEFQLNAGCPIWEEFLFRIMNGNKKLISFLQRAVGYTLTGITSEHCLFLLYGTGRNGKSVFLNTLMSLFGDYGSQAGSDTFMIKKNGGIPNDLARLRGSRLVATSEVEEGQRFAESSVKQMTGGDIVLARFLHNEYFEYLPAFKIWIAANHKPQIRGDDYAIWSRIHLIPFLVTIPEKEQDKELCNKLKSELSGILNWAIKGCLEWQRLGLNPPKEIKAETEKYRKEMNDFLTWLELRCETGGSYFSGATELYEDYKTWAEENVGWTMKQKKFGMKMSDYGFDRVPTPYIKYRGIKLRDLL